MPANCCKISARGRKKRGSRSAAAAARPPFAATGNTLPPARHFTLPQQHNRLQFVSLPPRNCSLQRNNWPATATAADRQTNTTCRRNHNNRLANLSICVARNNYLTSLVASFLAFQLTEIKCSTVRGRCLSAARRTAASLCLASGAKHYYTPQRGKFASDKLGFASRLLSWPTFHLFLQLGNCRKRKRQRLLPLKGSIQFVPIN